MSDPIRVVVAMSGGVDSSVAAALLKQQGYEVIGIMLRLWSEPGKADDNRCCTPDAMSIAQRVAARLSIPFYALDAQDVFYDTVVKYFQDGYAQHITPNPCLECNRSIRWGFLLQYALSLGVDFLATGHYARLKQDESGLVQLLRGIDTTKDQSYVLHVLGQDQLRYALLPIGELTKPRVRELARQFDLPTAERPDSQDLCFLGNVDYREFLTRRNPLVKRPGPILTRTGESLGLHQGLAFYTIGQRKGLGISSSKPLYVLEKDTKQNALIVGYTEDLGSQELTTSAADWISGKAPKDKFRAQVKIRYTAKDEWADVFPLGDKGIRIHFDNRIRDVTPGQAAVLYQDEICLGGGIIS
jgi:tRNA-specific 2-thiouridylase